MCSNADKIFVCFSWLFSNWVIFFLRRKFWKHAKTKVHLSSLFHQVSLHVIFLEWIEKCELSNIYDTDFFKLQQLQSLKWKKNKYLVLYLYLNQHILNPLSLCTICDRKKLLGKKLYILNMSLTSRFWCLKRNF